MSLSDKGYAVLWAARGATRPGKTVRFLRDKRTVDEAYAAATPARLENVGTVTHLSILPLIDFYPESADLVGEPGVSYLVTADDKKYLFDVGRNVKEEHPSPLLRNMERLGVRPQDLSGVFISHAHLDHVGGISQMNRKTFALSAQPVDLQGIPAFVPEPMTHSSATVQMVSGPSKLGEGLASTGPLARAIWLMDTSYEQALLVNVQNKGVVMIVGCGHPSLDRLLERARAVIDAPLYGVAGGLHFPVTASRAGQGAQTILGNGKLPWQRITRRETQEAAARLDALHPSLVALSAHDSCDWTLSVFRQQFGDRCQEVKVGREIVVA